MTQFSQRQGLVASAVLALMMAMPAHAQMAARDTDTGKLRAPTPAEAQALTGGDAGNSRQAKRVPTGRIGLVTGKLNPEPITYPDGTVEQELDAGTLSYTVMRRNADGSITMECATGEDAAYQALAANSRSSARAKKEHRHDVK